MLAEEHTPEGTRLHARVGAELATAVLPFASPGRAPPPRAAAETVSADPPDGSVRRVIGLVRAVRLAVPGGAARRRTAAPSTTRGSWSCPDSSRRRRPVGDGRRRPPGQLHRLDPATCAVTDTRTADIDPSDPEDLARGPDGTFWVGDTATTARPRTVAVIVLPAAGEPRLHRLTYPDGRTTPRRCWSTAPGGR